MAKKKARHPNNHRTVARPRSSPKGVVRPAEELEGIELDARRAERLQTAALLRGGRTPLTVIEIAENATALAESSIQKVKESCPPPPLACQIGCDWCCYLQVGTSVPEVARIVAYLRQNLSPEALNATLERIISLQEQRRQMRAKERAFEPVPCALLVDHRCSVYPVRPLTCRGCNSTNPEPCESFLWLRNISIPMYIPQHRLTTFVLDGMRAGLSESGLKGDRLELTGALRIALEIPDAVERWLAGEPVFASARLP